MLSDANYGEYRRHQVPWREVMIFFLIATIVSAPFRLNGIALPVGASIPLELRIFFRVFRGLGPAAAYFFMHQVYQTRVPRKMSLFGLDRRASAVAMLVVIVGLAIFGVSGTAGHADHYLGVITGLMLCGYALGEEYGWRGYLQQALAPLPIAYRILTIAVLWYLWHLNFLNPAVSLQAHLIHFLGLLLGSWGLLKVSESTLSLLFVAAVHLSFNIVFDVDATIAAKCSILVVSAIVWTILIRRVDRAKRIKVNPGI